MIYYSTIERRVVWLAALIQLVNAVDFMIIMPLGADLSSNLNISAAWIGYLGGSYTLSAAISSFLVAKYIDRFDRKSVAMFALFGLSAATFFCANSWNMESLLCARILAGIFAGPSSSIALAIVTDSVPLERRGKGMAIVMGAFSISAVAGVPLGLKLASIYGWSSPFYVVSVSAFIVVLAIFTLLPKMRQHIAVPSMTNGTVSIVGLLKCRNTILAFTSLGLAIFSTFLIVPSLAVWLQLNKGVPFDEISGYYFMGGVASFIVLQFSGRVIDSIGALPVTLFSALLIVGATVDGFLRESTLPPLVIFTIFMAFTATRTITASTVNTTVPEPSHRAAFMSLQSMCQFLFSGSAAIVSSMILVEKGGQLDNIPSLAFMTIVLTIIQPLVLKRLINRTSLETAAQ